MNTLMNLRNMESIRWAFNFHQWNPLKEDWAQSMASIQQEEKERICKFVFKKDAKASMAGRLLIRKLVSEYLNVPWTEVQLARTEKGRPFQLNMKDISKLNFNVSHQGKWAIIAAETSGSTTGCDVMRIEKASNKNTPEFFRLMKRQFTDEEWLTINSGNCEQAQLQGFYRNWCLKEAFVKALGVGITYDLQSLSFIPVQSLTKNNVVCDTKLKISGTITSDWNFQETFLDDEHIATTAIKGACENAPLFTVLTSEEIILKSQQITPLDYGVAEEFMSKQESPWSC